MDFSASLSSKKREAPVIFGILNITPDSFSDGGHFMEPEAANKQAELLIHGGARVIELGAASSHPDAKKISVEEELRRLKPALEGIRGGGLKKEGLGERAYKISVDSYQREAQRYAIQNGVDYLNDTSGFSDPSFYEELADSECGLILMHSVQRSGKADRRSGALSGIYMQIRNFFEERLERLIQKGIDRERLILDPGMGFFLGSNPELSLHALNKLGELKEYFHLPLMVSVSRKSFLASLSEESSPARHDPRERGASTLAAELFAWEMGADYIRTHDVLAFQDAWRVWQALRGFSGK